LTATAAQLTTEAAKDPKGAKAKFEKKYVFSSGKVVEKGEPDASSTPVVIQGSGNTKVQCFFPPKGAGVEQLKVGMDVKFVGDVSDVGETEVRIQACKVISK
jgi:hypothetical protein